MRKTRSLDAAYFEGLYRDHPDPWRFETSEYEARKYGRTLEVVGQEPVKRALELGCSIGVFTRQLALQCEQVVATELSRTALDQARKRCAGLSNIQFILAEHTTDGISGGFDLLLLSEVVYYWDDQDLATIASAIAEHLASGGRLILVHWLGETDYPRSADDAVEALHRLIGGDFDILDEIRTSEYRMDVWRRRDAQPTSASPVV